MGDLHLMSVLLCNGNKQHQLSPKAQFTSRSWIRGWNQEATYLPLPSFSAAKQWESLLVSTCSSRGISTPPSVMDPRWDSTVMQFGMRTRAARLGQRGSSCSSLQFRSSARSSRSNRGALPPLRSGGAPLPSRDHQRRPFPRGFRHRSVAYGRGRRPNPFFFE